jgi:hypothetical protein
MVVYHHMRRGLGWIERRGKRTELLEVGRVVGAWNHSIICFVVGLGRRLASRTAKGLKMGGHRFPVRVNDKCGRDHMGSRLEYRAELEAFGDGE